MQCNRNDWHQSLGVAAYRLQSEENMAFSWLLLAKIGWLA